MERCLKFIVPGEPKSKARPRFSRRGGHVITYTPDDTHDYENQVRYSAQAARQKHNINKPISQDMAISIKVYFGIPTSYSKKRKARCLSGEERPTKKPDSDNIAKIILDGLNPKMKVNHALHKAVCLSEGLYRDDKQVVDLRVEQILDMLKACDEKDDFICLTKQTGKHIYVCAYRVESIEE